MGKTKIEWTDRTWQVVTGCQKVSDGCKNCYAKRMWPRLRRGRPFSDVRTHSEKLPEPLRWRKPQRVFVCSMGDLFHPDVPFEFIAATYGVMAATPRNTYQIPTKRPGRRLEFFEWYEGASGTGSCPDAAVYKAVDIIGRDRFPNVDVAVYGSDWPLPNIIEMVSVEDQATADERIPLLLNTPAAKRGISLEPMLGPVDLSQWASPGGCPACQAEYQVAACAEPSLDWVIVGGESGPKARPMHPDWPRSVRDQCVAAGVPFFFKQWGEWYPCLPSVFGAVIAYGDRGPVHEWDERYWSVRIGKKAAGSELDGKTWKQQP